MSETQRERRQRQAAERWMGGARLRIPGVPPELETRWKEPPPYIYECHEALVDVLEPWVYGRIDIPVLRRLSERMMHLRGRVSMAKTLLALNRLVDFRTCNVGTPIQEKNGELHWLGRPIRFIAEVGGIGYYACKDRIDDLVKHFGISRHRQAGTDDQGEQYGRPSIRHIFDELFQALGGKVWEKVSKARDMASQAWRQAREVLDPVVEATNKLAEKVAAAGTKTARMAKRRSPEVSALLYGMLEKMLPGYRKPKPDTS